MTDETWTIKRALDWTQGFLASKGDENPRVSAQWLISEACGLTRMQLYVSLDRELSRTELDTLHAFVARRATGEPLQYITGEAAFRHITVKVAPGVLIPRPETEVLVSEALALLPAPARPRSGDDALIQALAQSAQAAGIEEDTVGDVGEGDSYAGVREALLLARQEAQAKQAPASLLVADICTGSGCIACSIAYEHPQAQVVATDIAPAALALAAENVAALGLSERVQVLESDLGESIGQELVGAFDLVVSNPPYIPTAELASLPREVAQFEPSLALDGGADGLDLFRRLIAWCDVALKPGGACAFELHETCLDAAKREAVRLGFDDVRIVADLAGRPRVLTARKPQ